MTLHRLGLDSRQKREQSRQVRLHADISLDTESAPTAPLSGSPLYCAWRATRRDLWSLRLRPRRNAGKVSS